MTRSANYLVAIIGRPNVGKSTLFNRLVGRRQAILSDIPGTTRDVLFGEVIWNGIDFTLADTAGLELDPKSPLEQDVLLQTKVAVESADLIIFLADVREGLQNEDKKAAELIRKLGKPVLLAINKAEGSKYNDMAHEFYTLGLGEPMLLSAIQGRGVGDMLDKLIDQLQQIKRPRAKKAKTKSIPPIKVALLGRPNVGKSTLFNKLVGQNRTLVSPDPGTTRDTISMVVEAGDTEIEFTDTAGLRRRGKVEQGIEQFSSLRLIKALQSADIAILLIEASEGIIAQDLHIAEIVLEEHKGLIIAVNKWDAIEKDGKTTAEYDRYLQDKLLFVPWAPYVYISALTGQRVDKLRELIKETWASLTTKIPSKQLNNIIGDAASARPPKGRRRPPQIYFASIRQVNPPTITLKVRYPEEIHFSYLRYLEKQIRQHFPMIGSPIRWQLVKSSSQS
ncbi:ribosome biogenesis GTPase Der [candidate division Kazan bacterium RBG_13_50_9]|uniref:GTPase Der n=1 Tax=candidate division Kazan bacterium RBG_13_50_9 TaxID=1798535 RepID=A0A1F4NSX9_UNCK3|nr:MAG: ribosome biogenesis GTPase Der [candidate division Kazan bacterium RBG_13_50_9]